MYLAGLGSVTGDIIMVSFLHRHWVTGAVLTVSFLHRHWVTGAIIIIASCFQTIGVVEKQRADDITSSCDYVPQQRFCCIVSRVPSFCKYLQHGNYYSNMTNGYISGKRRTNIN